MTPALTTLRALEDFEALLARSADAPLVIFKHSDRCGTSHEALDELIEHLRQAPPEAHYAIVTVPDSRELSRIIAARLGVRHETPQALVVRRGRVVWSASHFRVTAGAIGAAVAAHTP
jgi:bacillithiol system protein YtxJ